MKKRLVIWATLVSLCAAQQVVAATCVRGVNRAGCAGPNGAAVVRRPVAAPVHCANGVYRAGCVGPNGAAVVHKPAAAVRCANGVYRAGCVGPNGAVVAHRRFVSHCASNDEGRACSAKTHPRAAAA